MAGTSSPSDPLELPTGLQSDLAWLAEVLGVADGDRVAYLGRAAQGELRLLIPTGSPQVAVSALRRYSDDRGLRGLAQMTAGRAIAQLGLLRYAPGLDLQLPPFELVDHLGRALGESDLVATVTLGARRRNRKPVLQLLRPDGRTVGFAKVGWSTLTRSLVRNEAVMLRRVEGQLPQTLQAPTVIHHEVWEGREVVVTSPLRPTPFSDPTLLGRRQPPVSEVDQILAIANAEPGGTVAVNELDLFHEWSERGVGSSVDIDAVIDRHHDVALPIGLWHGDFTPWNITSQRSATLVWDWEFGGPGRPIGFDAVHRRFEQHRRGPGGGNKRALAAVLAERSVILAPLGLGLDHRQCGALIDLYLCELISRELYLAGQPWTDGSVDGLGPLAAEVIGQRVA